LIEATALKREKKYIEACEKLREAYSADGAENLMIEERLRLPMYLLLAGRNDEGWDELNRLNARYVDQISQPTIANQMRVFLKKEGKNRAPAPGILNISRENARALVYTRTQAAANASRVEFYRKNAKDFQCQEWLATLDSSTCPLCAARDLKRYTILDDPPQPIGHNLAWEGGPGGAHFSCRCVAVGLAKSVDLGGGQTLNWPVGQRASESGPVKGNTSFEQFLEQQGNAWQDRVLGPSRAALWRDKKLTLEQLAADYLLLLTAIRKIVELNESIENRIDKLRQMLSACDWQDFLSEHGGIEEIVQYFFPRFIKSIPTLTTGAVDELSRLGLDTPNRIAAASDETLLGIKGIGPAKLKAIRERCAAITENRDADRIENVNR
jgi:hypothetical protein